jgi:isoleucyl-tRNA synthetase
MYQGLVVARGRSGGTGPASVHHCDYPEADTTLIDPVLETEMQIVRSVVSLGRGLRTVGKIRVRQPLPEVVVVSHDEAVRRAVDNNSALIAAELNTKAVSTSEDERAHAHLSAKPNFRLLGPRFGPRMKEAAALVAALDEAEIARVIEGDTIEVLGERLALDDLVVAREPRAGVVVASDERLSVALDTTVTPELELEGMAREVVKVVQGMRREAGLDVSDRITVGWDTPDAGLAGAIERHSEWIAGEVLATSMERRPAVGVATEVLGKPVTVTIERS